MKKLSHHGFAAIEAVLVAVIIGILGFTGWYVLHAKHNTDTALENSSKNTTRPTQPSNTQFKLTELGVQLALPGSLKGLSYQSGPGTDDDGNQAILAALYDPGVFDLVKACNPTYISDGPQAVRIASLSKVVGQYDANKEMGEAKFLKQFATFHVLIAYPNGNTCTTTNDAVANKAINAVHKDQQDFVKAFNATAQEIK